MGLIPEWVWMRRAVDLGKLSRPEIAKSSPPPRVGVVVVRGSDVLGESFRGETGEGRHAEFGLLGALAGIDLSGATLLTTLEPCSRRNHPKRPCAEHLIERGISTVFIGLYDPNPLIYREGWRLLRDAGIDLRDFAPELRAEIAADNADFLSHFRLAVADRGHAAFDYRQNDGRFEIRSSVGQFTTRWTPCGADSIYAYDAEQHVAHARYARAFDEIDDPGALDFSSYTVPVSEGEIAVFRNATGFILVRIQKVYAGPDRGADHFELQFAYEVRAVGLA
jgi:pyrimidine deaminase RibD-like protein